MHFVDNTVPNCVFSILPLIKSHDTSETKLVQFLTDIVHMLRRFTTLDSVYSDRFRLLDTLYSFLSIGESQFVGNALVQHFLNALARF